MRAASDCLGPDSAVAQALPGFAPRRQQLEMAAAVEEAMADGHHLLAEAGTGVGKSFAYLVPVLLRLADGGPPIVVATRTIALQEQLVSRDIPLLQRALGLDQVRVTLAKGRGNYVCRRRTEMAYAEGPGLFEEPARREQLEAIRSWARDSRDGSLAELPFRPHADVWDAVKAESGNCLHQQCPYYASCAYQRARRELYGARLVIANHALVFADLALREAGVSVLPEFERLVLDEAHAIEEGAAEYFGAAVSPVGVARLLGRFMGSKRRTGLFGRVEVDAGLYARMDEVRGALKQLFDAVTRFRDGEGERRLREGGAVPDPFTRPLARLIRGLRERQDSIADPSLRLEWTARTTRLEETGHTVELICGALDPDLVYWAEAAGRGRYSILRAAPTDVAPTLRRTLFSKKQCVVLTSATLRVAGNFDHFKRRTGLDEPEEMALGSPFDFRRQCRLLLHPHMPDPRGPDYDDAVVARVRELVREARGGAFVLFTSYRALRRTHDALHEELAAEGLHVLRQGSDLRTRDIVDAFRQRADCVLFATDTFWQGVDVRGPHLRLVVITRLPFAVPDHPLQQARVERIEDAGGDAFRELSLPQAVLRLRQGFGRLIRDHDDEGAVAILDPRVVTKRYGRTFLRSLPECRVEER